MTHPEIPFFEHFGDYGRSQLPRFEADLAALLRADADPAAREAYQLAHLRALLHRAVAQSTYYAQKLTEAGIDVAEIMAVADLARLPVLTRAEVADHADALVFDDLDFALASALFTSGSTGPPLKIIQHLDEMMYRQVISAYVFHHYGIARTDFAPGEAGTMRVSAFESSSSVSFAHPLLNESVFIKLNIAPAIWESDTHLVSFITEQNPLVISGLPEHLAYLAGCFARARVAPLAETRLRILIAAGNQITAQHRAQTESVFRVPVVDVYLSSEVGYMAFEVPGEVGYKVSPHHILETVHGSAELLATHLHSSAMPFIRYRTGDLGDLAVQKGFPVLVRLTGRLNQMIQLPGGKTLHPYVLLKALERLLSADYRVTQTAPHRFVVRVASADADQTAIREAVRAILGAEAEVQVQAVTAFADEGRKVQRFSSAL